MQQVNLFVAELRPKKNLYSLSNVCLVAALASVLYGLLGFADLKKAEELTVYAEGKKAELERIEKTVAALKKAGLKNNKMTIQQEINALSADLERKEKVIEAFKGQQLGNDAGFLAYMVGIARESNSSMALQRIRITDGGKKINLKGRTVKPEESFEYLDRLIQDMTFAGTNFGTLILNDEEEGTVAFNSGEFKEKKRSAIRNSVVLSGGLKP